MTSFSLGSRTCRGLRKVSSEISRVGSEWQNTGFVLSLSPLTRRIPTRKPNLMERFALGDRVDELYNSNTRIGNVTIFICIEASRLSYLSTPLIKLDPILPHTHFNWVLSTSSRLGRDAAVISACSIFFPLALHVLRFVAQTCFSSVLVSSRTCKAGQKWRWKGGSDSSSKLPIDSTILQLVANICQDNIWLLSNGVWSGKGFSLFVCSHKAGSKSSSNYIEVLQPPTVMFTITTCLSHSYLCHHGSVSLCSLRPSISSHTSASLHADSNAI